MTTAEVLEILARELFVAAHANSNAIPDQRISRRRWYAPDFTEARREDWRTSAQALIASLAESGIGVTSVARSDRPQGAVSPGDPDWVDGFGPVPGSGATT